MPEHEAPDFERCSVCGRTALRGERLWDYVTPPGEPRRVCALCKVHAEAASWLPAELAAARLHGAEARPSRARALRERLARVAESARARAGEVGEGNGSPPRPEPSEHRSPAVIAPPVPEDPHRLARQAIDRFNSSDARRTVAGLMRSLGEPQASIQLANGGGRATVTVAWELSWYQWAVEPGAHGEVREVSKGKEIDELSDDARRWNGRVTDDGSLRLVTA